MNQGEKVGGAGATAGTLARAAAKIRGIIERVTHASEADERIMELKVCLVCVFLVVASFLGCMRIVCAFSLTFEPCNQNALFLCCGVQVNKTLQSLNLEYNGLGPEGTKHLGAALAVCAWLCCVCVGVRVSARPAACAAIARSTCATFAPCNHLQTTLPRLRCARSPLPTGQQHGDEHRPRRQQYRPRRHQAPRRGLCGVCVCVGVCAPHCACAIVCLRIVFYFGTCAQTCGAEICVFVVAVCGRFVRVASCLHALCTPGNFAENVCFLPALVPGCAGKQGAADAEAQVEQHRPGRRRALVQGLDEQHFRHRP